jgi:hypothetical protein
MMPAIRARPWCLRELPSRPPPEAATAREETVAFPRHGVRKS